jgi:uncharacterized protein (TIGR02594 family)
MRKKATINVPQWLAAMRAITGMTETPGDASNPNILRMRDYIAKKFPEQAAYAANYTGDEIAWCGLAEAFCMAVADISGPFGATDTDRWMWALAWSEDPNYERLGRPVLGCVLVKEREGGGHVCMYEATEGDTYLCRGGNQSDAVTLANYPISDFVGAFWPRAVPVPPIPIEDRPVLEKGDSGPDVVDLQTMIPNFTGEVDGDFGSITEDNVIRYQQSRALEVDGVVGPQTWQALYDEAPPAPQPAPPGAFTPAQQARIKEIANTSDIASYEWEDRGEAPTGWTQGMALAFATTYRKLKANHPAALEMAKARTDSDKDALNEYREDFDDLDMSNERAGADTLRHLYALMLGHGMRESSGEHCCGRDQSADNYDSDTCEAGAFQTSYNAAGASNPEFDDLMDEYISGNSPGYLDAFAEDVSCSSSDWESYGSGRGREFQDLCKNEPAFSAESCGLTLRNLCNHYGPIIRHETELREDADAMFLDVQDYVDECDAQPGPGPGPDEDATTVSVSVAPRGRTVIEVVGGAKPDAVPTENARVTVTVEPPGAAIVNIVGGQG